MSDIRQSEIIIRVEKNLASFIRWKKSGERIKIEKRKKIIIVVSIEIKRIILIAIVGALELRFVENWLNEPNRENGNGIVNKWKPYELDIVG